MSELDSSPAADTTGGASGGSEIGDKAASDGAKGATAPEPGQQAPQTTETAKDSSTTTQSGAAAQSRPEAAAATPQTDATQPVTTEVGAGQNTMSPGHEPGESLPAQPVQAGTDQGKSQNVAANPVSDQTQPTDTTTTQPTDTTTTQPTDTTTTQPTESVTQPTESVTQPAESVTQPAETVANPADDDRLRDGSDGRNALGQFTGASGYGQSGESTAKPPDDDSLKDRGDGRNAFGEFTGVGGYGKSGEAQGLRDYTTSTGLPVIDDQVRATLPDGSTRYYDGLAHLGGNNYEGIEVKTNSASLTASQSRFDGQVNSGTPATAYINGQEISIVNATVTKVIID